MLGFIEPYIPVVIGTIAGICSTVSFVPQVVKSWREGDTGAISKRMYIVTVSAFSLWIVYGLMIWSVPIIVFNALSLTLSGSVLAMKLRNLRRKRRTEAATAEAKP